MSKRGTRTPRQTLSALIFTCTTLLCLLAGQVLAQTTTGSIYGTVTDPTGAILQNVQVTAVNVQTGVSRTTTSNNSGEYVFPALDPGDYTVSATVTGFGNQIDSGIHLDASKNVHVTFQLTPGSVSETVAVTAATSLVDTRESQLGETVDQKRMEDLPLSGRNPYDLVQIVPGVTSYSAPAPTGNQNGTSFSVNGNRTNQDTFYLDGAVDTNVFGSGGNLLPNPDALQEFRLLTSNFDAEYGRAPGGVVNAITRSGTNSFHGLVYDYFRNNVLNAKNYFNTSVTPLKQNQFGGNFGGPIFRGKAFFFLSYQGIRIRTPIILSAGAIATPTAAEAMGNFSADPMSKWPKMSNGAYYACNGVMGVICPNLLDPVAQSALKYVPFEDGTTRIAPAQQSGNNTQADQGLSRIDYQLSKNHQISGTFFTSRGMAVIPNAASNQIFSYSGQSSYSNQTNLVVSDTWTISPTLLNTARGYYTLNRFNAGATYSTPTLNSLGSQAAIGSGPVAQPRFSITGYFNMGMSASGVDNWSQAVYGGEDILNWNIGNHGLRLGGSFLYNDYSEHGSYYGQGFGTFSGYATGNALGDFLLGHAASFRQNNGANHDLYNTDPAAFVQDDWRATRNLTLNLGVRWELFTPFVGQKNLGTFSPGVQSKVFPSAPLGLLSVGDPGIPDGVMHTDWKAFAPRVGFAYDVFGNGKTSLRGAYGFFYAARSLGQITNLEQQPFILDITVSATPNLVTPYAPGADPFPYVGGTANPVFQPGATLVGIPAGATFPYVQQYNLTVEHQLSAQWGLRLAYVGNVGRKFYIARDQNAPVYVPGASVSTAGLNARRPYEPTPATYTFGEIALNDDTGNSSYNSLQATVTRSFSHGFSFLGSYVRAKSLDVSSADPSNTTLTLANENSPAMDYGVSDFDIAHRFVASYLWSTPDIHHFGLIGRQALSGWQLNGITTLSTGIPFTVTSGTDSNLDGVATDRPNVMGNPHISTGRSRKAKVNQFFNTAAFSSVPAGVPYGSASRNMLFGPNYLNTDLSAFKRFPVYDKGSLELRAELFNVFNYVNLGNPTAVYSSARFGFINSTNGNARVTQFALRYSF